MTAIFYSVADCWDGQHNTPLRWHCGRGHFECAEWDSIPDGFGPRYCPWANRHHVQPADTGKKIFITKMSLNDHSFLLYTVFSYILWKYSVVDYYCSMLYSSTYLSFFLTHSLQVLGHSRVDYCSLLPFLRCYLQVPGYTRMNAQVLLLFFLLLFSRGSSDILRLLQLTTLSTFPFLSSLCSSPKGSLTIKVGLQFTDLLWNLFFCFFIFCSLQFPRAS